MINKRYIFKHEWEFIYNNIHRIISIEKILEKGDYCVMFKLEWLNSSGIVYNQIEKILIAHKSTRMNRVTDDFIKDITKLIK